MDHLTSLAPWRSLFQRRRAELSIYHAGYPVVIWVLAQLFGPKW